MCLAVFILTACTGEKKKPAFYDNGVETEVDSLMYGSEISADYDQMIDADIVSIPFSDDFQQSTYRCHLL